MKKADTHLEVEDLMSDEDGFAVRVGQRVDGQHSKGSSLSVLEGDDNERSLPLLRQALHPWSGSKPTHAEG